MSRNRKKNSQECTLVTENGKGGRKETSVDHVRGTCKNLGGGKSKYEKGGVRGGCVLKEPQTKTSTEKRWRALGSGRPEGKGRPITLENCANKGSTKKKTRPGYPQ